MFLSLFSVVIIQLANLDEDWDSNPYLALRNLVILPTVPWELLEFLTNVSEILKKYHCPIEIRTWTYFLRNFCPHRTAKSIFFKNESSWQKYTKEKKYYPHCTE